MGIGGLWWALQGTTSQAAQLSNLDGQQAATHFNLPTIGIVSSILCLPFSTVLLDESNSFFYKEVLKTSKYAIFNYKTDYDWILNK